MVDDDAVVDVHHQPNGIDVTAKTLRKKHDVGGVAAS